VNTDVPWPGLDEARERVLKIQAKLHQWATDSPDRRFCDLFNLVSDPAFLVVGWDRVRGNRGARTAGVDGVKPRSIDRDGEEFLRELRDDLKARRFAPLPVRERMIPKASGKLRRLGIPMVTAYHPIAQRAFGFAGRYAPVPPASRPAAPDPL
jgi:RNA-directed DNA polymerase